jgi:uncharacterized membrane protein
MFETNSRRFWKRLSDFQNLFILWRKLKFYYRGNDKIILHRLAYYVAGLSLETTLRYTIDAIYCGFLHPIPNFTVTGLDWMLWKHKKENLFRRVKVYIGSMSSYVWKTLSSRTCFQNQTAVVDGQITYRAIQLHTVQAEALPVAWELAAC